MTVISIKSELVSSTADSVAPSRKPLIVLKGKGKVEREAAFDRIAVLAWGESRSRTDSVDNLDVALGRNPSDDELKVAQSEWIIGRVADRLPDGEFVRPDMLGGDKIDYVRNLYMFCAAPVADGAKATKLQKHQTGRRTLTQHKAIRAAESAWSLIYAELGFSLAKTLKEKTAAAALALKVKAEKDKAAKLEAAKAPDTRAPQMAGSTDKGKGDKGDTTPSHDVLGEVPPVDAKGAIGHIALMAQSLQQYANKHAAVLPAPYGAAVKRFHASILQIEKDKAPTA